MPLPPPLPDPAVGVPPDASWPGVSTRAGQLASVTRSGFVESRHLGHAVAVDPDGVVVASIGDPDTLVYPRSSIKPLQATTCLLAGAHLDGAALAIGAGSHRGHPDHVALVRAMLADAGLRPDDLQTPLAWPSEAWARDDRARAGGGPTRLHHNCSGKHAAMLAACVAAGWDTRTYRDPDHPLQRRVRVIAAEVSGADTHHVGVDGCGAPVFAVTILGLARATGRVARTPIADADLDLALGRVADAMRAEPWAVAGIGAQDTVVMQHLPGVVAKGGAEGVQVLGTTDGVGVAVKVLDGSQRAAMPAALDLLAQVGVDTSSVADAVADATLGHGVPVGRVHAVRPPMADA